jgi:hypothetical protein
MQPSTKKRCEMSIAEMIVDAGLWLDGEPAWRALSLTRREQIAFERTACKFAYPTWETPVNCAHLDCRIARGELPKIAKTNSILRAEMGSGWLRFIEDRQRLARIVRAYRKAAHETGVYDPWDIGWQDMVFAAAM